ncbi:MAG: hypothetical protein ACK5LC_08950 [Coprobacillaceae bacterium]
MKKRTIYLLFLILLNLSYIVNSSTITATNYFQLQQSSNAYWIDQGQIKNLPATTSSESIPYGSVLRLDFNITNNSGNLSSSISSLKKQGISFLDYYSGILKINGNNASKEQYNSLINGQGLSTTLSPSNTSISIDVMSVGTPYQKIAVDLQILSNDITSGMNTKTYEHAFYSNFSSIEKVNINFYDSTGSLIQSITTTKNEYITSPNTSLYGYNLIGFNTSHDGSGTYFHGTANDSINLYAIFEPKKFTVNYFVDDQLFESKIYSFGTDASNLVPPDKEHSKFVKWNVDLSSISNDVNAYAIYEDSLISGDNILVLDSLNGADGIEKNKNHSIQFDETITTQSSIKEDQNTTIFKPIYSINPYILYALLIVSVSLFIFSIYKVVKHKKYQ